jgi:hypothetical protein
MKVYFAFDNERMFQGGWLSCLAWASQKALREDSLIKIAVGRPESKDLRVVAEVDAHLFRIVKGYRTVFRKRVERYDG